MLAIDRSIAIMIGTAAELFVDDTAQDADPGTTEEDIWEIVGPILAAEGDDIAQLATCEADLRLLGYCAPDDTDGAARYFDGVALWCDIMSTDAPDTKAELLALRAGRWLRLAARMLRGEAGQPSPDHTRAILGVTEGPLTPADAKLVADFGRVQEVGATITYQRAAAAQAARAVCETCNDTHTMTLGDREVPCTKCPTPCQACRAGGNGAYCAATPCACDCHVGRMIPRPPDERRAGVEALIVWSRNGGLTWPGYEIATGPEAGAVFLASDKEAALEQMGVRVRVTYTPADQFARME